MRRATAVLTALTVLIAGCGQSAGTVDEPRVVEIDAQEFAFAPETIDITPGETVEFIITNNGSIVHEFVVTNQEDIDEHLESGHEGHDEGETDMDMEGMMLEVEIDPGETESLTVTFDDTDHQAVFACLIEGHYEAGMHGEFTFAE